MQKLSEVVQEHTSLLHLGVEDIKKFYSIGQWPVGPENWIKYHPISEKVAKNIKIFTSKLNLKAWNHHIWLLLQPQNTHNKPCGETVCLVNNWWSKK